LVDTIKITKIFLKCSDMFRVTEDPSSGSFIQCLAKIIKMAVFVSVDMDVAGVMAVFGSLYREALPIW
jgi:hypothetical protein